MMSSPVRSLSSLARELADAAELAVAVGILLARLHHLAAGSVAPSETVTIA